MDSNKNNLSYLVINLLISDEDLVQQFAGMFGAALLDAGKDANFMYYAVQNHDPDEVITWLEENFGSRVWSVNTTIQASENTKDEPEVKLLKKSDKYDEFISSNQVEPTPDSVPKSKEQLERESKLKATPEELSDDFEGEIPPEESGISDDLDDIEYVEEVEKHVTNSDIESGRMLDENIAYDESNFGNDLDEIEEDADEIEEDTDEIEEDEVEDEAIDDYEYLADEDYDSDIEDGDFADDEYDSYLNEDDLDENTFLSKDDQYKTYVKFLNNDIDLLNNSSEDLYNQMIRLNKPYSNDEDLRQYLQLAYDMAVMNQLSSISKPNIENLTKNLENYKDYAEGQDNDTKQLKNKLNSLDIIFDNWLSDRPARFLEFYDYLNDNTNDNIAILNDIQTLLNNSRNRVDAYSDLLADDLDAMDPNVLKRQHFNGILARSYEASKNLYNSSRQQILNTTAAEAQEVISEQLAEITVENSKLKEELENLRHQPKEDDFSDSTLDEDNTNIDNGEIDNNSSDDIEANSNDNTTKMGVINLTGGDGDTGEEDEDIGESNQDILSDTSNIGEEEDELGALDLDDDDEYEYEEDSLIDKIKLMPVWKKAVAGGLALLLALGLGFGAKRLIFGGGDKNQEQVEQGIDDEDYRKQRAMAFIQDNFKVGDELLLNVDGKQSTYTVADYPKDGNVGLILKDSNDKVIELDESTLAEYIQSDQSLSEKQKEFYEKYDNEHKNTTPSSNTQPIQDEDLSVDFGNVEDNTEESNTESNVDEEKSNEESEDDSNEEETNSNEEETNANAESTIKRDNITIEIIKKNDN